MKRVPHGALAALLISHSMARAQYCLGMDAAGVWMPLLTA